MRTIGFALALVFGFLATTSSAATNEVGTVKILRPWELRRISTAQRLNYYRAFQTLVSTIENSTFEKGGPRNALLDALVPPAFALPRAGDECVIGGYRSTWYRRGNSSLSCAAPGDEQMIDIAAPAVGAKKPFFCGSGESARTAYCNSAVFLYSADSGERSCQSLDGGFSSHCQKAFESRYGKSPERLTVDIEKFSRTVGPEALDKYYTDYEGFLTKQIADNNFDKTATDVIRKQIEIINKTKSLATSPAPGGEAAPGVAPLAAGSASGAPGKPAGPPTAGGPSASASVVVNVGGAAASVPAQPNVAATSDTAGAAPAAVDPDQADEPPTPPAGPESPILGKELSCVRDGLSSLGYKPSEKFIALVGTGVQASNGAYNPAQEISRKTLQARVISMVRAYGFCDEDSYPSRRWKKHETQLARRWLTADGGKAKPKVGLSYLQQMSDPASLGARKFYDLYGLRSEQAAGKDKDFDPSVETALAPFVQDEQKWDSESLPDRQRHLHDFKRVRPKSDFDKCHRNARERREKDQRFKLSALRMPPAGADGKRAPIPEASKTEMSRVQKGSQQVCETMARACGIETAKACSEPTGAVISGASPGAPPPAPPGQPGPSTTTPAVK